MCRFITEIKVNKLFHLSGFTIPIDSDSCPHLILTGKNGSGKTVLLNAIADFLEAVKKNTDMSFLDYKKNIEYFTDKVSETADEQEQMKNRHYLQLYKEKYDELFGKVDIGFNNLPRLISLYQDGNFIITFYQADRKSSMSEPENPTKPVYNIKGNIKETSTGQFLNFLSDLKIQEALARNEKQDKDADNIAQWFSDFEKLLGEIYQDSDLRLAFNYRDYSFRINTGGKSFKFTEMSDGFTAILDIVADIILKMQSGNSLVRAYRKSGIVLIDEVETHLHLGLQKTIMPLLTRIFPGIQFIVTTHSPFVLGSINNAVAFDLEHRETVNDLTDYSFESIAEGYFGVKSESSYANMQLENLERLLSKDSLSASDAANARQLLADFDRIPETVSPLLVGQYLELKTRYFSKIKGL